MPEFKPGDFLVAGIFITVNLTTVIAAWMRLKYRIERNEEIHSEIKEMLDEFIDSSRDRFDKLMSKILSVEITTHEIKTDVAVVINEQKNILKRLDRIEE